MTAAAATTTTTDRHTPLRLDSIQIVDIHLLSQSELYSLSLCSDSSFDLNRCDDVVIPKIDRSVFNESAGSRKQIYSRLHPAPAESSSTTTTIHRRTPHLRSSHTPLSNNFNDPEQAENSEIISTLKQLLKSDPNFEDVVQIELKNDNDPVMPELPSHSNVDIIKRKRGRPRKHENVIFLRPPAAKRIRNNAVKKIVVFDSSRDRETVNNRGVAVNMVTLAGLEDPYGPDIRRRTDGMLTEDDLLGFLRGLNGQWGSRRKKRRVVDASEFGDVLPKGWKLSLCIKRKEGSVWLFCRRYISPSGRPFESCKEISTYLQSIVGEENLNQPNHARSNDSDDIFLKGASANAADLVPLEDIKGDGPVQKTSSPAHCEKEVALDIEDPIEVHVGELLKCLKCLMIFEGKDDLLEHQVSSHDIERLQPGTEISDCVLIEGGILECQICHVTYNERNQYNGHIGSHVKTEIENTEASLAPNVDSDVDSVLMTEVPSNELQASVLAEEDVLLETSEARSVDKLKSASPHSNHNISAGTESTNQLVHDLNLMAHDKRDGHIIVDGNILVEDSCDNPVKNCIIDDSEIPRTDGTPVVAVSKSDFCLGHEASLSADESKGKPESSGETRVDCFNDKSECSLAQERSSGSFLLSQISTNEQMGGADVVGKDVVGMPANIEVPKHDAVSEVEATQVACVDDKSDCNLEQGRSSESCVPSFPSEWMGRAIGVCKDVIGMSNNNEVLDHAVSETKVLKSSICAKNDFCVNMDHVHIDRSEELTSEKENSVNCESSSAVFPSRIGLGKYSATGVEKLSTLSSHSNVNNPSLIPSEKQESPQKGGTESNIVVPSLDKSSHGIDSNVNRPSSGLASSIVDGQYEVRSNAFDSYRASGMQCENIFGEENKFNSCSSVSLWQEVRRAKDNVGMEVSVSTEEPRMQINSEISLFLSDCEQNSCIANNAEKASANKSEAKRDNSCIFRNNEPKNNESIAPSTSSQNGLNTDVLAFDTRKNIEFSSLVPSDNEQAFGFQDDVTILYDSAMEECKQENSERGSLNHFCSAETSDDIFGNKMYSTPLHGIKFNESRDIGSHELSLAFGNPHALYADAITVGQKTDLGNYSVGTSKIRENFGVQTDLSMVNNSMEDLQRGRDHVGGLFSLSCNNETSGFRNNANNTLYPGTSEGRKSDANQKLMIGLGSNHGQPNEEVPCGMWRTGEVNRLQSVLTNPSHEHIESPSCFHSFDIMSEKAEDGLFRLDEGYNDGMVVSGFGSGRPEPVEFSFLTGRSEHNQNAFEGGSRDFSYNSEMEQEFDSSFWLGKNPMMPNMAGRNHQVTSSICAWCRNEFHLHSGTQAGIGSLCPTCSAGISGQVNMM